MAYMYKLLSQDMTSYKNTHWKLGVPIELKSPKENNRLCSPDLLHCYSDPELAVIFNPLHADIINPRLFKICTSKILASDGLKMGCKKQTLIKELELPSISVDTKIAFAILCSLRVYKDAKYVKWAEDWLNNSNFARTVAAANAAANAPYAAANSAYAAYAANFDAYDAYAARDAAYAAYAAAYAAYAARNARDARDAVYAAANAANVDPQINFISILQQAKNI